MPKIALAPLALLLAATSCATAREPIRPLALGPSQPCSYRADLRGRGLEVPSGGDAFAPATPDARQVEITCVVQVLDRRSAAELLGARASLPGAWTLSRAEADLHVERAKEVDDTTTLFAPELTLLDGSRGEITTCDETSFVSDFALELAGDALVADPVVETLKHGFQLRALPRIAADGTIDLDLTLIVCGLQRPIPEIDAHLPGVGSPVSIQTPVVQRQELCARVGLSRDECLVLAAPGWERGGSRWICFVTARERDQPRSTSHTWAPKWSQGSRPSSQVSSTANCTSTK